MMSRFETLFLPLLTTLICLTSSFVWTSCGEVKNSQKKSEISQPLVSEKTYVRTLLDEKECEKQQERDWFTLCSEVLYFKDDGSGIYEKSPEAIPFSYRQDGSVISLFGKFLVGDEPREIRYTLSESGKILTDEDGNTFKRSETESQDD